MIFTNIDRRAIVCRGNMMGGDLSGEIVRHSILSGLPYISKAPLLDIYVV